ncbi:hypothetical protein CFOL_v3_30558, partial [Cephalotus follicularis]
DMEGLQRSTTSYRRQGSSGLVWDVKSHIKTHNNEDKNKQKAEPKRSQNSGSASMLRSSSDPTNGGGRSAYRTVKVSPPLVDPPSPKVAGCGLCGIFGKPDDPKPIRRKPNKRM